MELKVVWDQDGATIRLHTGQFERLGLKPGDHLRIERSSQGMILRPLRRRPRYALAELVLQCDPGVPESTDTKAWSQLFPIGREFG
ncbi:PbsX family transcriptional regulator [Herbaspirillum sp. CAH-3]|uniref:PbsX family transcriptional regulator n=1 Tax=Herbaspirillum sp. CAH-3 TaxID=2605746 RepID=UPI0012ACA2DE|nr:PbsX family transcriptional regulator [Herbaspirillum sp. CAH-3]MRT28623.1 PbsX family transcriptional regulator [Herbaspirillum sp. CAH-3]